MTPNGLNICAVPIGVIDSTYRPAPTIAQFKKGKNGVKSFLLPGEERTEERGQVFPFAWSLDYYEKAAEELRFIKAVAQGLADITREGNTVTLAEAKKILGAE